jgi:hypothetical protein
MLGAAAAAALVTPLARAEGQAAASSPGAPARFLTPAELALLDELTEIIIPTDAHSPGARAAGVAGYLDGVLAESLEPERQATWRAGLQAVEALSLRLNGKPLLHATPVQRVAVVTRMAAGESNPRTPEERFFKELKRATVQAYYTSKIGIHQDQEYKGNVVQPGDYAGSDPR